MSARRIVERVVATGGDPAGAIERVVREYARPGDLLFSYVKHDDDCPCVEGRRPMAACTCELVELELQVPR